MKLIHVPQFCEIIAEMGRPHPRKSGLELPLFLLFSSDLELIKIIK
jgi:hypothetical protein